MRLLLRRQVRQRDGFACSYCGVTETQVGSELTIDHFQPRVAGGDDTLENLLYCCFACNSFKGDLWSPESEERLLHPLFDNLTEHLRYESDGRITPLTPTGQFHCDKLQLNRFPLVANRHLRLRDQQADLEHQVLQNELAEAQRQLATLLARFSIRTEPEVASPKDGEADA
jgi:uncharacterized protein (TIGR02646 family)